MSVYYITNECIGCGMCVDLCPVVAIEYKGDIYGIDQDECIGCEECERQCPVEAIKEKN